VFIIFVGRVRRFTHRAVTERVVGIMLAVSGGVVAGQAVITGHFSRTPEAPVGVAHRTGVLGVLHKLAAVLAVW
jgi:K+ transporter